MNRLLKITTFAWFTLIGFILAIVVSSFVFWQATYYANKVGENWAIQHQSIYQKTSLVSQIRELIGYGGAIHHFKNYLLSGDKEFLDDAKAQLKSVSDKLSQYQQLPMERREQVTINKLVSFVDDYFAKLMEMERLQQRQLTNMDLYNLDAIEALKELENYLSGRQVKNSNELFDTIDNVLISILKSGTFAILLLLCFAGSVVWYFRCKLINPITAIQQAIKSFKQRDVFDYHPIVYEGAIPTEIEELMQVINEFTQAIINHQQQQKVVQKQLSKSELFLKTIFQNAAEGIIVVNEKGIIQKFNNAAGYFFNYQASEVIGQNVACLLSGYGKSQVTEFLAGELDIPFSKSIIKSNELVAVKKDGSEFPISIGVNEIKVDKELSYCAIIRDLTKDKQRESRLRQLAESAEQANQAKSQFLSSMSHELRTPLNAILGFAQLLSQDEQGLTEEQNDNVKQILTASRHLLSLINEILDLAQIESGKMTFALKAIDTNHWLTECIQWANGLALGKNITISDQSTAGLPSIIIDPLRGKQALLNILSNAIKYNCNDGSVTVTTELIDNDYLRISVADTGVGILQTDKQVIFERFERLSFDNSSIEGTGLGLALTKQIVEGMGGQIDFNSTPEVGTKFWIDLPIAK
ncbi:ATP-binding protein [Thalassotalea sp. G2M2-11]|uniref:ATP-binding protein n=1 Tax=Thalassotalea sp. G2M2-11 TaxID=2787627 RepID=UPI0019D1AE12|nr:ATP-binding protein [Thalassotalea sp. G2M2-11]